MKKLAIVLGSFAFTAGAAYLAFLLGAFGFDTRRFLQHEGRLRRLLAQQPRLEQVAQGLEEEGSRLLAAPVGSADLRRLAAERGGPRAKEIVEKGTRWPQTRAFLAADMIYVIYFDEDGVMRDFTCVSR